MNIKRAVSLKFGVNRTHDRLPTICLQPMQEGTTANIVPDMDKMLKEYYGYRGWVWETGQPSKEKLLELGLTKVAEDLYP
jgi:aldehyde:ferredoxin oxidoreductase